MTDPANEKFEATIQPWEVMKEVLLCLVPLIGADRITEDLLLGE